MTPSDRPADLRPAPVMQLADQRRAIERALEERRDAEGGWLREEDTLWGSGLSVDQERDQ
ncbi:MAG: hypothetical protein ABSD03_15405 [Vulcanimicrobiaceae bacterium]|jgi:hypothetical protein